MKTLWINARFIDRPITGVERVAREVTQTLLLKFADESGVINLSEQQDSLQIRLIAPRVDGGITSFCGHTIERRGLFNLPNASGMKAALGHLWEQSELPWLTRGDALLNLCNTGPLLKRKQYLFLHDAQPFAIPANFNASLGAWYRFSYKTGAKISRKVLVNSQFTKLELLRYIGGDENKFVVCPLGSDHMTTLAAEPLDTPLPEVPYLVAFASENPNKNFSLVMDAMQRLGENAPTCLVVGKADGRVFSTIDYSKDSFVPLGSITDGQLVTVLQNALALVYPSFYEGFGLPPLEASALGCPVIVSNTGALSEVNGTAALQCSPTDVQSLVSAIQFLTQRPSSQNVLRRRGIANSSKFTWEKCAQLILDAVSAETSEQKVAPSAQINPSL